MKRKASTSYDEMVIKQLRKSAKLAAEYLQFAMEDSEDRGGLLVALRHVAEARVAWRRSRDG